ncbi:uracil-DNA glycosylase family protein [Chromatiaceae bacterium AAb-1]|nr:uracil-DNA glycosylase family protein [Chromatiaceae bacterium AAb-1]
MSAESFFSLLQDVRSCTACQDLLPQCKPVLQADPAARILIAGQAPGRAAHRSGIPFDDASGDRLRNWLGMDKSTFYNAGVTAILPMGFCFPGTGKNGDLPPRPECAALWRKPLLEHLPNIRLTLVIGQYAHLYHFGKDGLSLTERVTQWQQYWPDIVPLPHPSPRNNFWLQRNPWFEQQLLPALRQRVISVLSQP